MDYMEEEEVNSQRFDITVIWPDSDCQLTENEVLSAIENLAKRVNEEATVEVEEVLEPTY